MFLILKCAANDKGGGCVSRCLFLTLMNWGCSQTLKAKTTRLGFPFRFRLAPLLTVWQLE